MRSLLAILTAWAGLCFAPVPALAQGPETASTNGNAVCLTCHKADKNHKVNVYHSDCAACHTVTDPKHLKDGGKNNVVFPASEKCESCHKTNDHKRMNWSFSAHKRAQVQCRDCHGMHSPKQAKMSNLGLWKSDSQSAVCMDCHQDVAARLNMPSHHPVKEGALTCVSCHDPHNGKKTDLVHKNDQCYTCHQAVRGPKVFEHVPVVEDCTTCHNPHGTPNRRLLNLSQPMQCLQCHSMALVTHPQTPAGKISGVALRNCTSCHGAIHGSHIDPKLKH